MEQKRRVPQKRKIPLKKRLAYIIVNIADERERSKAQKQQKKAQEQKRKAAPQKRTQRPARPAPQGKRPAPGTVPVQRRPLTPQEQRRRAAIRAKKQRKRIRNIRIGAAAVVVLLVALILSRTVLFKIQTIEVTNPDAAKYTVEQISAESGVVKGTQNLFSCNLKKVAKNIEQRLPYIGKAEVKRDFPSTLRVTVTPTETAAAIAYGTGYLLIDMDGKMLESTLNAPEGVAVLRCNTEFELNLGQYIGVSQSKEDAEKTQAAKETVELFKRIMQALEKAGLENITLIDIRDTRAITLMYENRLTLHLGTEDRLDDKLGTAVKTISAEADTSNNRTGAIDLTVIPYAFSRDTFADASVPETTDEATTESNNG